MSVEPSPIAAYLTELAARLPPSETTRGLLDETRDHLAMAAAAAEQEGVDAVVAERRAVQDFGQIDLLVDDFCRVIAAAEARRQAQWQTMVAFVLATCGLSVFSLIPLWRGEVLDLLPPPPVAFIAGITVVGPSLMLRLSHAPSPWTETHWLKWFDRARTSATVLFRVGLPVSGGLVTDQIAHLAGAPHMWLLVGVGFALHEGVTPVSLWARRAATAPLNVPESVP